MADKVAQYIIGLGADGADLKSLFADVKSSWRSTVSDLQATAKNLDLFADITNSLPSVQRSLDAAKAKVKDFGDQIDQIKGKGGTVTKDLTDGLAQAEKAAASASKELARQQQQLATLGSSLQRAGVDTNNLSAAQLRLAEASKVAAEAATVMAAKQALGLKTLADVTPEIAKQKAAFEALKASGVLSATEIATAQKLLTANIKELEASVTKGGTSFKAFGEAKTDLIGMAGPALAAAAAVGSIAGALAKVTAAAKEFNQALAEGASSTDLSKQQIAEYGRQAQQLAQDLGVGVTDAVKGLFSVIRAGAGEENGIEALRISAEAAKASFSDLGTGVSIAKLLLQDFKVPVSGLGGAFDVLKASVGKGKEGFEAFAASGGPLLAVARASNIGLEDLTATLDAMVKGGIGASDAIGDLTKIIAALGKPESREALHGIGIDATDLVTIFSKLGASGAKLRDVIDLTGVSQKNAAAIAALINDSGRLGASFDKVQNSSGSVKKAVEKMYDSPKEISERFHATLDVTAQKLGNLVGASGRATVGITALLGGFNNLLEKAEQFAAAQNAQQVAYDRWALSLLGIGQASEKVAAAEQTQAQASAAAAAEATKRAAAIETQRQSLNTLSETLIKNAQALQAAVTDEAKAVAEAAQREVAAIELAAGARRGATAEERKALGDRVANLKDAAAQILAVQQQAADTEFDLIATKDKKITDAIRVAFDERRKLAEGNPLALKKLADEELEVNRKSVSEQITLYQGLYDRLYAQAKASQDKVLALDSQRLAFNEDIALKLRNLRTEGLGEVERYQQSIRDVEELTAKAREARADGNFALEKKYTDQAIATSDTIKKVVNADGVEVVSAFEAQQVKIRLIKTASDEYSKSLKEQGDAAQQGATKAVGELDTVRVLLGVLKTRLDELREKAQDAIRLKIDDEIVGLAAARAALNDLVKPETKVITVVTVKPGEAPPGGGDVPAPVTPPLGLNRGGSVPMWMEYAQRFADGGSVFQRPGWSKVPGQGNGDTVPALLSEGSFVVKKAASQLYGDRMMSRLVKGFAGGGDVNTNQDAAAIFEYAKYIRQFLRHPLFEQSRRAIDEEILLIQKSGLGNPQLLNNLLESVKFAAANYQLVDFYGKTSSSGGAFLTKGLPNFETWSRSRPKSTPFASGGPVGTDTVPAMLTPGEWVIPPGVAKFYGGGFLHALNDMRIPAPPAPKYLADGGAVPGASIPTQGASSFGGINITINGAPADFANESTVRRMLLPVIREIQRRT